MLFRSKLDNSKISNRSSVTFYIYDLIVDYPNGVEVYAKAILSTKKDRTVLVLLYSQIAVVNANINDINNIADSLSWKE